MASPLNHSALLQQLKNASADCDIPPWGMAMIAVIAELTRDAAELFRALEGDRRSPTGIPDGWEPLKKAAGLVGFSPETVRVWANTGLIRAGRRGGGWVVEMESLRSFAALDGRGRHRARLHSKVDGGR